MTFQKRENVLYSEHKGAVRLRQAEGAAHMLFKELDKLKRTAIMTTIVLIFIGLILMLIPEGYISFLSSALAFGLLVAFGVAVLDFIGSSKALINYIMLSLGLLAGLLGFVLLVFEELLIQLMSLLVGALPIISGLYGIGHALVFARRSGKKGWWVLIIFSVLMIAFGAFIFMNPWMESTRAVMQVIGGTMMFSAFVSALGLIWIWPIRHE